MLFNELRLPQKLPLAIAGAALISGLLTGIAGYWSASVSLSETVENKITSLASIKAKQIDDYLASIEEDMKILANQTSTAEAINNFNNGFKLIGANATEQLQDLYIHNNPHPLGEKEKLDRADDGSIYSTMHARYHDKFRTLLYERGYYDIFLFNLEGDLVYSVFKELDYATNVNTGEWKDTDLGNAFRAAQNAAPGDMSFFDFRPYAPSYDAPASFISTAVFNSTNDRVGVLVFQMPIGRIDNVMQNVAGLGETGDSFLVGSDFKMRSNSVRADEDTILAAVVDTPLVRAGLNGEAVSGTTNWNGETFEQSAFPVQFLGVNWVAVTQQTAAESFAPITLMQWKLAGIATVVTLILGFVGLYLGRSIASPITRMTSNMSRLASGDRDFTVTDADRKDEIGELASALATFQKNAEALDEAESERKAQEERADEEKRKMMHELADKFEREVGEISRVVASAATELEASSKALSANAEQSDNQSTAVAAASEESSVSLDSISQAAKAMNEAVQQVRSQVEQSLQISQNAVQQTDQTDAKVNQLDQSAQKIGEIIDLISAIAEQTNLLALNATIEAARAGEAGKGFAVVAAEVKNLAAQTTKATDDISSQIKAIQGATTETVNSISAIRQTIEQMNESSGVVAEAVEQQTTTSGDIARGVEEAAIGGSEISRTCSVMQSTARETGQSASEVLRAAGDLSVQSERLAEAVNRMVGEIRAA